MMRFGMTFFVAVFFFSAAYAGTDHAASCEEVDLSQEMPGVRDQGDGGYCVAFATADALGYELGLSPLEVISAAQLVAIQRSPLKLSAEAEQMVMEQVKPSFSQAEIDDFRKTLPIEYFAAMSDDDMMNWMGELNFSVHEEMFGWDRPEGAKIVPTLVVAQLQSSLCTEADLPSEPFKANLPSEQQPDFIRQTLLQKIFKYSHDPKLKNFTLAESIEKFCETSPRSAQVTKKININAMSNSGTSYEARKRKEKKSIY